MFSNQRSRLVSFLRWSEKYTKTDMVYVFKGASLSLVGQGVGLIASLVLAVVISHLVPKDVYGTYKFVLSVVSILSLFSLTGIGGAVFQAAARGHDGALRKGYWENIKWSLLVFLSGLVVAAYYFLNGNSTLAVGILLGASLSPFIASGSLFGPFLGGKKDFLRQTIYGIIDNVIPILIFIGVIFFTTNPAILLFTYFASNALAALFFYGRTIEVYHATLHKHDDDLLSYSKHLSAMGIIGGIADNLDQVLLFHYVGATQVAIYNFAVAIPEQIKGPSKNLAAMIQAQFAIRTDREIRASILNKVLWITGIAGILTVVYFFAAPVIFRLLFPNYIDTIRYSQIYALVIMAIPLETFTSYLASKKLAKELYIHYSLYSVVQISSMLIGVIFWGLLGLIIARVVTRLVVGSADYLMYRNAMARGDRQP